MPEVDGIELLRSLQDEPDRPQVIMISGHGTIETAVQATKLGAFDFIEKPFSIDALLRVVGRALEYRALPAPATPRPPMPCRDDRRDGHAVPRRRLPERTIGRSR